MNQTNFLPYMFVGSLELRRAQQLLNNNLSQLASGLIKSYGLAISENFHGVLNGDWLVTQTGDNTVQVAAGKGLLLDSSSNPGLVSLGSPYSLSIPVTDGTYNILAKIATTNTETGTISISNGSNVVNGTNTLFTQLFAINRQIIINGNAYVVLSVASDTQLQLAATYIGTNLTNITFAVGGYFTSYPPLLANNYIYQYGALSLVVKNTSIVAGEYALAQVVIIGGVINSITDKRSLNLLALFSEKPLVSSSNVQTRRKILFVPNSICADTANANANALTEHIKANDSHASSFQNKFILKFYKGTNDKTLAVDFYPFYTDTGLSLSSADAVKWQLRIDITGQSNGSPVYLNNSGPVTYDISGLPNGFYEMTLKLNKAATAYNLSVLIEEIYKTGNYEFIIT